MYKTHSGGSSTAPPSEGLLQKHSEAVGQMDAAVLMQWEPWGMDAVVSHVCKASRVFAARGGQPEPLL